MAVQRSSEGPPACGTVQDGHGTGSGEHAPGGERTSRAAGAADLRRPRRIAPRSEVVTATRARIVLVGGPILELDGSIVATRGPTRQRSTLALAYLLLGQGRRVPSDELAEAVWPEGPPASWTASLRKVVSDARTWLAGAGLGEVLSVADQAYRLDLPDWATTDVEEAALAMVPEPGRPVALAEARRAADLLSSQLLPGLDAPWLRVHRDQARQLRLGALEAMSEGLRVAGEHQEAIAAAREVIDVDPLRESAYRLVMAAHRDAGRIGSALRVYEECRNHLVEELGSPPSPTTVAAYQALLVPLAADTALERPAASAGPGSAGTFADAVLAMEAVASRTAIANLEGRLAAVESDPHPDPLARVEVLIALGQARWALSGATDQLRRISLAAGEAAISLGSPSHFGAVAALASTTTGVGEHDADTEDLCARALSAFEGDPEARARILSLQAELRAGGEAVALSEEAVAIARGRVARAAARHAARPRPEHGVATPARAEAGRRHGVHGPPRAQQPLEDAAPTFEPLTRLQGGELDWFRAEADRLTEVSANSTQWEPRFYATAFRAVLAHLAGDLARGFLLADQLLAESREEINAMHSSAALYLALTRDSGGVANLMPIVEDMAGKNPRISSFQAALALGLGIVGDHARAATTLDALVERLDDLPRDHIWVLTLGLLSEAVSLDGNKDHATRLLVELDPYAGQLCTGAHATVVLGTMDWCRGILAATAHLDDLAVVHLRDALELERRIEAPLLQARTSAWLAAVLHRRADPADAAEVDQRAGDANAPGGACGHRELGASRPRRGRPARLRLTRQPGRGPGASSSDFRSRKAGHHSR